MPEPVVLRDGEGERLEARGTVVLFKAIAASTGGTFSLMERSLPPGGRRPALHRHESTDEAFFVLDGEIELVIDGRSVRCDPRDFALVPRGVAHTFGNGGSVEARVLVVHAPAMDPYFRELQELWSRSSAPTREDELALMRRHGTTPAG